MGCRRCGRAAVAGDAAADISMWLACSSWWDASADIGWSPLI